MVNDIQTVEPPAWEPMLKEAPSIMVKFGPELHQEVHLTTAERMLTMLAGRNPKLFRELYGAAVLGER